MSERCKAFFNGLEVQVAFSMSRSQGIAPDVGELVWLVGTTQPSSAYGTLVLTNGSTTIVTMPNCALRNPTEKFAGVRSMSYQILDRRWRWKTPKVFGQYNVRDEKNLLVETTKKNPRELASILLDAMGEVNYDVSVLPTDVELAPNVIWHYTPAAVELEKLCAMLGCSVNLLNNNTVLITVDNIGTEPDNTGLMRPVEAGLIINPAPDYISAFANDTLFDGWLTTEAIGRDEDGSFVPIDLLSYVPNGSWTNNCDPSRGYDSVIRGSLRGTIPDERIDKIVSLANRTVFRLYRVTGFPKGQLFFPGFTVQSAVSDASALPETGDATKVYRVADKMVIWDGTQYVGVAYTNSYSVLYMLVDPLKIESLSDEPRITTGSKATCIAAQTAAGIATYTVIGPGCTAVDPRILLPLLQTRVENALDELQLNTKRPAEVCGLFNEDDFYLQNKTAQYLTIWKHGHTIDAKRGHVQLGAPAYMIGDSGIDRAEMYLRCGYGYRTSLYGSRFHRRYDLASGNSLGIANDTVDRRDIAEYRVQNYTSDYNDLSAIGVVIENTSQVDDALLAAATEHLKQYQNYVAPKQKVYTPFRAIDTNGIVQQVSYRGGMETGVVAVSIGGSFDPTQPPAKLKRQQELQKRSTEAALQDFRAGLFLKDPTTFIGGNTIGGENLA